MIVLSPKLGKCAAETKGSVRARAQRFHHKNLKHFGRTAPKVTGHRQGFEGWSTVVTTEINSWRSALDPVQMYTQLALSERTDHHRGTHFAAVLRMNSRRQLAALISVLVGAAWASEPAHASTWHVNSCGERISKGITTLRYAATHAISGDVVDLSALTCGTITLTAGEIPVGAVNLTIQAAPGNVITIDAAHASRIFTHTTTGSLDLRYLTLVNGTAVQTAYTNSAAGGCVYNRGPLVLRNSTVSGCSGLHGGCVLATASGTVTALGTTFSHCESSDGASAIYAATDVSLTNSTVTYNHFTNAASSGATIQSLGTVFVSNSTISNNTSASNGSGISAVGALFADHMTVRNNSQATPSCLVYTRGTPVSIAYSAIENNTTSSGNAGQALCIGFSTAVASATVFATTIADNSGNGITVNQGSTLTLVDGTVAGNGLNGIAADPATVNVRSSTIASNNLSGILITGGAIDLQSSIVAKNGTDLKVSGSPVVTAANNLILKTNLGLPGTVQTNPRLTPLAFHGGPTRTFGLSITSPAIDAGNNAAGVPVDQRGTGYARVVGAAADIGAYERQAGDDELFYDGFD